MPPSPIRPAGDQAPDPGYALAFFNRGVAYYDKREYDRASASTSAPRSRSNPNYANAARDRGITNSSNQARVRHRRWPDSRTPRRGSTPTNYAVAASNRVSVYENKRDDDRVIQEVNQIILYNAAPAAALDRHQPRQRVLRRARVTTRRF